LTECLSSDPELEHSLIEKKKPIAEKTLLLVVTSDMGLCGSYNLDILRLAEEAEIALGNRFKGYYVLGSKGISYLRYRQKKIYASLDRFFDTPDFSVGDMMSNRILSLIESGEINSVKMISSQFRSSLIQKPALFDLLPLKPKKRQPKEFFREYEFEPALGTLLDSLIPLYLSSIMLYSLLEARVSELYSRQNAMRNATENADNLIKRFTLEFNKARQSFITQEIIEIVNGAEALKE
jgi:F-type H+-transporting ATPase subunit gamma